MANQLQNLLTGAYFAACGFQSAKNTTIPPLLRKINPNGGTAMRDSLIQGCQLMLKLNQTLKETGTDSAWNFVHVVLTDGADCNSKNSLEEALKIMLIIGKLIEVKSLKIIFIGVGVEADAEKELKMLAAIGGENSEYYNVNSSQIGSIFNKIEVSLGLQKQVNLIGVNSQQGKALMIKQELNPYLQVHVKNFALMFNLDVSGSMSGTKWGSVCTSVSNFIGKLGDGDLVSALVFNDEVKLLSNLSSNDKLFEQQKSVSSNSQQSNKINMVVNGKKE